MHGERRKAERTRITREPGFQKLGLTPVCEVVGARCPGVARRMRYEESCSNKERGKEPRSPRSRFRLLVAHALANRLRICLLPERTRLPLPVPEFSPA